LVLDKSKIFALIRAAGAPPLPVDCIGAAAPYLKFMGALPQQPQVEAAEGAGGGAWARLRRVALLLFKAWTTPQRICGCRPPRSRLP
jgi:hypothetical protein